MMGGRGLVAIVSSTFCLSLSLFAPQFLFLKGLGGRANIGLE